MMCYFGSISLSYGKISIIQTYKYGILHGEQSNFFYNGQLATEGNFVRGKKHGVFKQYLENGQLIQWITYKADTPINLKTYPIKLILP